MGAACNQITQNFQLALEQLIAWQTQAIGSSNPSQLITRHTIVFPYQQSGFHWNLGLAHFILENLTLVSATIVIYDPFGGGEISTIAFNELQALIRNFFKAQPGFELETVKEHLINGTRCIKQQEDGYLCGAIVAENAKGVINGEAGVFRKFYPRLTNAAKVLRIKHINEVRDPAFTRCHQENHDLDPQGDKLAVKVPDANKCLQAFTRALSGERGTQYLELLDWVADIYQSAWQKYDRKVSKRAGDSVKKATFIARICKLGEKAKNIDLDHQEKVFIAQFTQDNKYTFKGLEQLQADPEAALRIHFRRLCLRKEDYALLGKIEILNLKGEQISFFDAFFKNHEGGVKYRNGGYCLLEALAKEQGFPVS